MGAGESPQAKRGADAGPHIKKQSAWWKLTVATGDIR